MNDQIFYTVDEVAQILKVKRHFVYLMLKSKRLRGVKLSEGKRSVWRIPTSEINAICSEAYENKE